MATAKEDFKVLNLPSIWQLTSEQTWLVEGFIPENALVMLSGESGGGKSTVALILADAVANGQPFLDMPTQQRTVLIVDKENGLTVYHERFDRFEIKENPNLLFWGYWNDPEPPGPVSKAIEEFITERHPLIIFDSFVAFNKGDEQDASATRLYTECYRKLVSLGATVIFIHHTGKGENTREYRGSSDIKASVDVAILLTAKKPLLKLLTLHAFKVREGVIDDITVTLEGTKLVRVATEYVEPTDPDWAAITKVLVEQPGVIQLAIFKALPNIPIRKVRKMLLVGVQTGQFRMEKGPKNASLYFPGAHYNAR